MTRITRRLMLKRAAAALTTTSVLSPLMGPNGFAAEGKRLHLATFTCDVTPPAGHPLCGGWIEPVRGVDDPLRAVGLILLGMGRPVVLCAVDWCELRNEANLAWCKALAQATHTVPENVAVQCVHQHNAPMADVAAERLIEKTKAATPLLDLKF